MANPNKKKSNKKRVFAMILAGLLVLLLLIPYVVQIVSYAASSQEVLDQLAQLQQNAVALDQQQLELQQTIVDTQSEAMDYVARKAVIDQTIQVLQTRITNTQDQILEYNLLISARQEELDQARARESELYQHYQDRIRAMEEYGRVSYWAVLFQANSLSDMIDRIEMVQEIARADQEMMEELGNISAQIEAARDELELARSAMEGTRQALAEHLQEYVTCYAGVRCEAVTEDGAVVSDSYGNRALLEADAIVLAAGMRARASAAEQFRGLCPHFAAIGDCLEAKNVRHATRTGFDAACQI